MPAPRHLEHIALYACLTSLTALAINALLPALTTLEAELPLPAPLSGPHLITLFILGMSVGELLFGPLSDAIGRKAALLIGLALFALGALIACGAQSGAWLVAGRLLQGIGVAGPKIATRAMIRDQYSGDAMARIMSLIFALFILVPMLSPFLGQALLHLAGWRAIFAVFLGAAAALGLWLTIRQPETLAPENRQPIAPRRLARNARAILTQRRPALLIVVTGLTFGAQLVFLSTAAPVFATSYGIDAAFPIFFAALSLAIGMASLLNARIVIRFGMARLVRSALLGQIALGALVWALAAMHALPLAGFVGLSFGLLGCIGILFGNLNALTLETLGHVAGLAAALIAALSSLIAVLFAAVIEAIWGVGPLALGASFCCAALLGAALVPCALQARDTPEKPCTRGAGPSN